MKSGKQRLAAILCCCMIVGQTEPALGMSAQPFASQARGRHFASDSDWSDATESDWEDDEEELINDLITATSSDTNEGGGRRLRAV